MDHCGIDLAMESSSVCVTDRRGKVLLERVVATEEASLREVFDGRRSMRCLLEASPLAEWAADLRVLRRTDRASRERASTAAAARAVSRATGVPRSAGRDEGAAGWTRVDS